MRKQTKYMAVLSTAAFMLAVTPAFIKPAYAKSTGWVEENGNMVYYQPDGELAINTWKKQGDDWYYLDDDGSRLTDSTVDEYYVGEDGKRVFETWIKEENEDFGDTFDDAEYLFHYYDQYGKEVVSKWKYINDNWYYFDEEGRMLTGMVEIDGNTYYLGNNEDGTRKSGWFELEDTRDESDNKTEWFYFEKDGIMVLNQVDKKIGNDYFSFVNGILQTGWYQLPKTANATASNAQTAVTIADYQYYDEDGKRADGWRSIEGAEGINDDGEVYKFYFKKGAPYHAKNDIETFTIDGKKYGFNTKGEMQTELKEKVTLDNGTVATYFFDDEGIAQTGKQVIYSDKAGIEQTWFFHTDGSRKGMGYTGIRDNAIYEYGLRKDADKDLRYAPAEFEGKSYLVNASGTIQTASSSSKSDSKPELGKGFKDYKDENEQIWVVDKNGIIQ